MALSDDVVALAQQNCTALSSFMNDDATQAAIPLPLGGTVPSLQHLVQSISGGIKGATGATGPAGPPGAPGAPGAAGTGASPYLTPEQFGAVADAVYNPSNGQVTGTDNTAAFRACVAAAAASGRKIFCTGRYRINSPGVKVNSFSIASGVLQLNTEAAPTMTVGDRFKVISSFTAPYMNGATLTCSGVGSTYVTASVPFGDVANTNDAGGVTAGGRGLWDPHPLPAGTPMAIVSPALPIDFQGLCIEGNQGFSSTLPSAIYDTGLGYTFSMGADKTYLAGSITTDANQNSTIAYTAASDVFPPNVGEPMTLVVGTNLYTCAGIASVGGGQIAGNFGLPASSSNSGGVLHIPWTEFSHETNVAQGYSFKDIALYQVGYLQGTITDQVNNATVTYFPETGSIFDFQSGSGELGDVTFFGGEHAWAGIQADFGCVTGDDPHREAPPSVLDRSAVLSVAYPGQPGLYRLRQLHRG